MAARVDPYHDGKLVIRIPKRNEYISNKSNPRRDWRIDPSAGTGSLPEKHLERPTTVPAAVGLPNELGALTLMSVAATPVLANYGKEPITPRHYTSEPKSERHAERMRGVPDLRQANDPYWSPCDYNSDYDPNGCL